MTNKLEEIRIPCECVGGSILEAIPNNIVQNEVQLLLTKARADNY